MKGLWHSLGVAQAKKAPATATIAKRMEDVMPGDTLKGRRDRAMVVLGFAGAFRKSEVVAPNVEDLEICDDGVCITIPRSKTDQEASTRQPWATFGPCYSNPNVILGCALTTLMASVEDAAGLYEQQLHLTFGIRLVLDALRHDEHLACREVNRTIAKIDT
jgi:hypothetical protein